MTKDSVTAIYWNTWFYVQNGRIDNGTKLIERLGSLINDYRPDIFGLNEVLINQHDGSSPVLEFLKTQKYTCHFAPISPVDNNWIVGNVMATKQKPRALKEHVLGADTQADRRGYTGCTIKAISADLVYGPITITTVLIYMSSLFPADWGTHIRHRRSYERMLSNITNPNLIIGGDFNETKYMLPWLRLPRELRRKTGSLINPTWRLNGKRRYLGFANYDNVVYSEQGRLKLQKFKVLSRYPSDHSPLLAIFKIK